VTPSWTEGGRSRPREYQEVKLGQPHPALSVPPVPCPPWWRATSWPRPPWTGQRSYSAGVEWYTVRLPAGWRLRFRLWRADGWERRSVR
jgi:hypothetical protein